MKDHKSRHRTVGIIFTLTLLLLAACTSQTVKMIHPQTGATADCSGSSVGIGPLFSESFVDSCARVFQDRGYVPVERLTPEDARIWSAAACFQKTERWSGRYQHLQSHR